MSLRAINHNLLPVLLAILRERNITLAARSLGLRQPAVSKSLMQLRTILGDELLVRAGRRLILTKLGEASHRARLYADAVRLIPRLSNLTPAPSAA